MWNNIEQDARLYFVHSYYVEPQDSELVAATSTYGVEFCTAIHKENLFATQFHPEKSRTAGLQLLKNFYGLENLIFLAPKKTPQIAGFFIHYFLHFFI